MRAVVALGLVLLCAVGCQPVGGPAVAGGTPTPAGSDAPAIGAPPSGLPRTLDQLLQRSLRVAEEWQDAPVPVEIEVDLDAQGRWMAARVVYLAADADRFLALTTAGSGFEQEQPTLTTLGVPALTAAAVEEIPALPEDAAAPADLAAMPGVADCGITGAPTVLYITSAPVAWDGTTWTTPPTWRATVTDGGASAGAAFDSAAGGEVRCLDR